MGHLRRPLSRWQQEAVVPELPVPVRCTPSFEGEGRRLGQGASGWASPDPAEAPRELADESHGQRAPRPDLHTVSTSARPPAAAREGRRPHEPPLVAALSDRVTAAPLTRSERPDPLLLTPKWHAC